MIGITSAVALNEIVNAPGDFVSQAPYLVVSRVDWIQTRYLFVRSNVLAGVEAAEASPLITNRAYVEQDPSRTAQGPNSPIEIPILRLQASRGSKIAELRADGSVEDSDGYESDVTLREDQDHLDIYDCLYAQAPLGEWAPLYTLGKAGRARVAAAHVAAEKEAAASTTRYVPGQLDYDTLELLPPPTASNSAAGKQLMKRLDEVRATLADTPNVELGWHMDMQRVDNMFQWIVEMHSFPADLPLTKDMLAAGVTSVVLELRFLDTFPFTPPFVRVVRPQLLPFSHGGGGHVTVGGALCMELLTSDGWLPSLDAANVLLQVRVALCDEEPRPARLAAGAAAGQGYGMREAIDGYVRACNAHGWKAPAGFVEALRRGCVR
jgi:ubiquitin-conjugating enzyme E2 Q